MTNNADLVIIDERSDQCTQRNESKLEKERRILKQKENMYNLEKPLHKLPPWMENGSIERRPSSQFLLLNAQTSFNQQSQSILAQ